VEQQLKQSRWRAAGLSIAPGRRTVRWQNLDFTSPRRRFPAVYFHTIHALFAFVHYKPGDEETNSGVYLPIV